MSTLWYLPDNQNLNSSDPAKETFYEALALFGAALPKSSSKSQWLSNPKATSLKDILDCVRDAQTEYENRRGNSKLRECLSNFADRVHHYGNIMDVLVQHHPEYVALAWGAMKVLFVGVVNHERSLVTLSGALSEIADQLPRVELATRLYPTKRMKHAVAVLYAHVLMFLIRAHGWYQESKLSHAIHSITRPSELRYADLLKKIAYHSQNVTVLAVAGSQAEQRDMHTEQQEMNTKLDNLVVLVSHLRETVVTNQIVNTGAHIEFRQSLSNIQLSQIVNFVSTPALIDPHNSLQNSLFMRNKRRLRPSSGIASALSCNLRIQRFAASSQSSLILIKGTRQSRFCVQDFCTNLIEHLRNSNIPALWILRTVDQGSTTYQPSTVDLLKALISQAIKLNLSLHTDHKLSSRLEMYMSATTETQWFALLASVLEGLPVVYITVDIEILGSSFAESGTNFSWPTVFLNLFQDLRARGIKTLVKVLLVSYGSPVLARGIEKGNRDLIVQVGGSSNRSLVVRGKARCKISGTPLSKMSGRQAILLAKPAAFD